MPRDTDIECTAKIFPGRPTSYSQREKGSCLCMVVSGTDMLGVSFRPLRNPMLSFGPGNLKPMLRATYGTKESWNKWDGKSL